MLTIEVEELNLGCRSLELRFEAGLWGFGEEEERKINLERDNPKSYTLARALKCGRGHQSLVHGLKAFRSYFGQSKKRKNMGGTPEKLMQMGAEDLTLFQPFCGVVATYLGMEVCSESTLESQQGSAISSFDSLDQRIERLRRN